MARMPSMLPLPMLALAVALLSAPAGAVVHVTGDGSGNTTAPPDDPGFANVGSSGNNLTGVYLGDRWVLSAHHVGEQSFTFGGIEYPAVTGSRVQLETSPGVGADLELVRIQGAPPLAPPVLSSAGLSPGEEVVLIGNGWSRAPDLVCWDGQFVEISCDAPGPPPAYSGYERLGPRVIRWGRNLVTQVDVTLEVGGRTSIYFVTDFDESGVADEAQVVTGDSGGGVFADRGGTWELVGIHSAALTYTDPPQPSQTAVFGNASYVVDLHPYVPQIESIMGQAPLVPLLPPGGALLLAGLLAAAARRGLARARRP